MDTISERERRICERELSDVAYRVSSVRRRIREYCVPANWTGKALTFGNLSGSPWCLGISLANLWNPWSIVGSLRAVREKSRERERAREGARRE